MFFLIGLADLLLEAQRTLVASICIEILGVIMAVIVSYKKHVSNLLMFMVFIIFLSAGLVIQCLNVLSFSS